MDHAEEFLDSEPDHAIKLLDAVLEKNPKSARAYYFKARILEEKLKTIASSSGSKEYNEKLNQVLNMYMDLINRYQATEATSEWEYDILPRIFDWSVKKFK